MRGRPEIAIESPAGARHHPAADRILHRAQRQRHVGRHVGRHVEMTVVECGPLGVILLAAGAPAMLGVEVDPQLIVQLLAPAQRLGRLDQLVIAVLGVAPVRRRADQPDLQLNGGEIRVVVGDAASAEIEPARIGPVIGIGRSDMDGFRRVDLLANAQRPARLGSLAAVGEQAEPRELLQKAAVAVGGRRVR